MPVEIQAVQTAGRADHGLETAPLSLEALYPNEIGRWILVFGLPMLAACVCIGLAFGTSFAWFYGGAILFGPGVGVLAIIYLAISSDTNGADAHMAFRTATVQHDTARHEQAAA